MIEFYDVSFRHQNGIMALREINLKIETNTLTAIVGENGAGKTTLVRHINGLLKPSQGKVLVFGEDTKKQSVARLSRKVGIVFQNPDHQLFSDTVENEILFGLRNFGIEEKHDRLEWALDFFDLSRYRNVSPMLLSGGEKKRLCIAFVLAWDPDVLILDEPTVGQDYVQKERLLHTVQMLISQGKTVVIVSHDIEFIWPLQPRTVVMAGGRILADGPAKEIFRDDAVLEKARLLKPQLLDLSQRLGIEAGAFSDVYEAKRWLTHRLGRA